MIKNENNTVFIFDFDGVIVNSVKALYSTYIEFLLESGITGTKKEFKLLNGSKLSQIITYFKEKYHLSQSHQDLLNNYNEKLSKLYGDMVLNEGLAETLTVLKNGNFTIALASSAKRNQILFVLEKYKIADFFEFIISGDDVKNAKPSPEIYHAVKAQYPNREFFVIEDSDNGMQAAILAETKVIFFNAEKRKTSKEHLYEISAFHEILKILSQIKDQCFIVAKARKIQLKVVDHKLKIIASQERVVNELWNNELTKRKLTNNNIVCYRSHVKEKGVLVIEGYLSQYKYFFAQLKKPELKLNIQPIGVSGIIIDEEQNTLLARRNNVTEYNGFYELVPSGSIDSTRIKGGNIDFQEQLMEELEEETNLKKTDISVIVPLCVLLDKNHDVYDICAKIYVKGHLENLIKSDNKGEYRQMQIVKIKEMQNILFDKKCVPTLRILLNNIDQVLN